MSTLVTTSWLPFTSVSQSGSGTGWTDLNNILSSSGSGARVSLGDSASSRLIRVTGVTLPGNVQSNWTLVGIEFSVERRHEETLASVIDDVVQLVLSGSPVGDNLAASGGYPDPFGERRTGGEGNLWGSSLTRNNIGANFGVEVRARNTSTKNSQIAYLRAARVRFTFEVPPPNEAVLNTTDQPDSFSGAASAILETNLTATEQPDTLYIGSFAFTPSSGEAFDGGRFFGPAFYATPTTNPADLLATETIDLAGFTAAVYWPAALSTTEGIDTYSGALEARHEVTLGAVEVSDTASVTLEAIYQVSVTATENTDTFSGTLAARHEVTLIAAESSDNIAADASVYWPADLLATEPDDTFTGSAAARHEVSLTATEAFDIAEFQVLVTDGAILNATEGQDTGSFSIEARHEVGFDLIEISDTAAGVITRNPNLYAGIGTFEIDGFSVPMKADRTLFAEPAEYLVSSDPLRISYDRSLVAARGFYTLSGLPARLYQSAFFYTDSEIVLVRPEIQYISIAPQIEIETLTVIVPPETQVIMIASEDNIIAIPPDPDPRVLVECRGANSDPRLRLT